MGFGAAAAVEEEAASPFFPLAAATLRDSSGHSSATPRTCTQASAARGAHLSRGMEQPRRSFSPTMRRRPHPNRPLPALQHRRRHHQEPPRGR